MLIFGYILIKTSNTGKMAVIEGDKMALELREIAYVRGDFGGKFGLPRQSGLAPDIVGRLVFAPQYGVWEAVRGIEEYSHLWLLWGFSMNQGGEWSPTVRPPKLGGNRRVGVFATRSPNRPNPIGLSCVELLGVEAGEDGRPELIIAGGDMAHGTPVYDIKPYLPYTDCRPEAKGSFAQGLSEARLQVDMPEPLAAILPQGKLPALKEALSLDPRPGYQVDPEREYGMDFAGAQVRFKVSEGVVTVTDIRLGPPDIE